MLFYIYVFVILLFLLYGLRMHQLPSIGTLVVVDKNVIQ